MEYTNKVLGVTVEPSFKNTLPEDKVFEEAFFIGWSSSTQKFNADEAIKQVIESTKQAIAGVGSNVEDGITVCTAIGRAFGSVTTKEDLETLVRAFGNCVSDAIVELIKNNYL